MCVCECVCVLRGVVYVCGGGALYLLSLLLAIVFNHSEWDLFSQ